jgi:membrane protease YdiL (CAAX protease family)
MKVFFRSILRALIYPAIYLAVQLVVSLLSAVAAGVCYILRNTNPGVSPDKLLNEVTLYIYNFSVNNVQYMLILSAVITLGTVAIIMRKNRKKLSRVTALLPVKAWDTVLLLIIGLSLNLSSEFLLSLMKFPQEIIEKYQHTPVVSMLSGNMLLNAVCIVLFIPVTEELIFRGFAFNRLRSGMSFVPALILQAVLFSVAHFNLVQSIGVLLAGVVLGLAYMWSKSLYGSILVHASYNCTSLILWTIVGEGASPPILTGIIFASPAVLLAGLILLFRSSAANPGNFPPQG